MEMLILKGIIYDLKDNFAEKLRLFLNKSPNAEWVALVGDYEDPAEEMDELRAELTAMDEADSSLRSLITELADDYNNLYNELLETREEVADVRTVNRSMSKRLGSAVDDRDKYFNLLSVAHDRNIFLESEILVKHQELSNLKESIGNAKMIIDNQEGWVADQYSKVEDYVRKNDLHVGYDDVYSHADIIIDRYEKAARALRKAIRLISGEGPE